MLPSTGYFNGINCPFYDNGLCERPYCHYRHVKKDFQSTNNEGIESGAILQKLVSAAVQRVLQQTDGPGPGASVQQNIVEKVLDSTVNISTSTNKATYNPTPIAELNKINNLDGDNLEDANEQRKRHIPVPYTPRKPTSLPIKRPIDDSVTKPFVFIPPQVKYTPGSTDNVENDKYTPPGAVESTEKYLPGTEKAIQEYTPDATSQDSSIKRNYVPSTEKTANKKKILEYKPTKVTTNTDKPIVTYQPTPRSLAPCFSSDEEEPDPKKMKISNDLNGFDDLGPEFDILDQILDEEKEQPEKDKDCDKSNKKEGSNKSKQPSEDKKQSKDDKVSSSNKYSNGEASHSEKKDNDKSHRSHHKSKSEKKEKSSSHDKDKHDRDKQKHKKSSHRSSSKDRHKSSTKETDNISSKDRDNSSSKDRDKSSSKDRDHSSSKYRDNSSSKHRDNGSSKDRDKGSNKDRDKDKGKESSRKSSKDKKSDISLSPKHSSSKSSDSKKSKSSSKSKRKEKDREHHKKSSKDTEKSKEMDDSDPNDYMDENGHEDEFDLSDADEETIAMECKKIFEEYVPMEKPVMSEDHSKMEEDQNNEYIPSKKRISRTADKNIKVIPKAPIKPNFKVNAAHTMAERLAKVREFHSSRHSSQSLNNTNNNLKPDVSQNISNNSSITLPGNSKIRIAHVPYASTLLSAKKTISLPPTGLKNQPSTSSTISQTVQKGSQRVAHIPNEKFIDRPGVLEPLASKIPANIRSTYLNMMIDECLKLYVSVPDAYARAQNEELTTSKKCSTVQIYKNSAVMTVSRLRRELQECNGVKKSDSTAGNTQSNSSGSWSIEGRNKKLNDNSKEFVGARFYSNIKKWVLTEEQLRENGFPRPHESGEKGRANIYSQNKQKPPKGYFRTCCRCKKEYTINKKGFAVVKEECIYHPNNKYRVRGEARYQCCSQDATSDGCCIAPCHVYEYVDYDNLKGYVKTMPPEKKMDDYGIYSLDCEMCYTTHGLDLTRITVINSACKVVYETLIKPLHPIIDYNTRYSGITEEQMSEVKTTLLEVQATLLAMFNSKTILVGHSLESDFKALKLIHDTVIDTSVLFPHKMGPPYKRALRNLSSEHLKKIIQNSVDGHDSAEDAMVCMELLHYKLKEDLKTR